MAMKSAPGLWRQRSWRSVSLLPAAMLFRAFAAMRRKLYKARLLSRENLPVPVIVVGNIAVGGSGKTPTVLWLVEELRKAGYHPGIVSRGHGSQAITDGSSHLVTAHPGLPLDPVFYGDEPVMLARQSGCAVAIGINRPAAARALLAAHPECNVIVSDDGMQHYRLERAMEIAVVDETALGNCWPLPAGPLREPLGRLAEADLILAHGELSPCLRAAAGTVPIASMRLVGERFRSLSKPDEWRGAEMFIGKKVHALAGIGQPQRFFDHLAAMGIEATPHTFPDHHRYSAGDLGFAPGEPKLMTSKDAVKCVFFMPSDAWELPVRAVIDAGAAALVLEKLGNGCQTA